MIFFISKKDFSNIKKGFCNIRNQIQIFQLPKCYLILLIIRWVQIMDIVSCTLYIHVHECNGKSDTCVHECIGQSDTCVHECNGKSDTSVHECNSRSDTCVHECNGKSDTCVHDCTGKSYTCTWYLRS